jgi:glycosyltransferase involved in cell wall biosynthesis
VLARLRTVSRGGFKLVLCNGTLVGQGFEHLDHVQDLTPAAHEYALAHGADPARHTTLPLGFAISPTFVPLSEPERAAIRQQHGLPLDQRILLSVAALNRRHKRLDYVIREVASIPPNRRPFLLLLGEPDDETPALRAFAEDLLGNAGFAMRTIPPSQVTDLCRASDIFVLASFHESFGRALVEASATGIPCLVHGYPITEFVLGPNAYAGDLSGEGALARMITGLTEDDFTADRAATRHAYAYEMFSWDRLTPGYLELFQTALDGRTIAG